MIRIIYLLLFVAISDNLIAQHRPAATASTSAEVINPHEAGMTGNTIDFTFEKSGKAECVELKSMERTNRSSSSDTGIPLFTVKGSRDSYGVTLSHGEMLLHNKNGSIQIETLQLIPLIEMGDNDNMTTYSLKTVLRTTADQPAGNYKAPSPCSIIFHFN